jgi:hypothetical protein
MALTPELDLIAKIVETGQLKEVLDANIVPSSFSSKECRESFEYILDYWRDPATAGNVPTLDMVEEAVFNIHLPDVTRLKMNAVIDNMLRHVAHWKLADLAVEIDEKLISDDPRDIVGMVQQRSMALVGLQTRTNDLVLSECSDEIMREYEEDRDREGIRGIPWPWPTFNEETGGANEGEMTIFYGRPKSMKTWLLLSIAAYAYDFASRRVLIYTREMHPKVIRRRLIATLIGAPYQAYKKGRLAEYEVAPGYTLEDKHRDVVKSFEEDEITCLNETGYHKGVIITGDRDGHRYGGGVMGLRQKIEDHKPDLVCVDGIYLMRDDRTGQRSVKWQNIANVTQDMHNACLEANIPFVGTTQANRDSEDRKGEITMRGISFSDSFAMDCDYGVNVIRKGLDESKASELALVVTGARETSLLGFPVNGIPATNFSQMRQPARHADGSIRLDPVTGRTMYDLVVFQSPKDIQEMFKGEQEARKEEQRRLEEQTQSAFKRTRARMEQNKRASNPTSTRQTGRRSR